MSIYSDKARLRKQLREQRKDFRGSARSQAEKKICHLLQEVIKESRNQEQDLDSGEYVAVYQPFDGEVDLSPLWGGGLFSRTPLPFTEDQEQYHSWVFPVHLAQQALTFCIPEIWSKNQKLPTAKGQKVPLSAIKIMLVPGVAFCGRTGLRLGLGGGHYDRTFALAKEKSWSGLSFGVGFSFQVQSELPSESWDYPLDGLVTELGVKMFN